MTLATIFQEVRAERARQDAKHGVQLHLADGTALHRDREAMELAQKLCDMATARGTLTYRIILWEEVCELFAERPGSPEMRAELVQVMAVCAKWLEAIDARGPA